jgi:hypothetical protein
VFAVIAKVANPQAVLRCKAIFASAASRQSQLG